MKATIFVGQNLVSFGSANYTPFELAPVSSTNYKDESVLFTDDTSIVNAFKTKFELGIGQDKPLLGRKSRCLFEDCKRLLAHVFRRLLPNQIHDLREGGSDT